MKEREEYLVSMPEARRLVASAPVGTEETALVVPELPVSELRYHRSLVDDGAPGAQSLSEHAVVELPAELQRDIDLQRHCERALNSRIITRVGFYCWQADGSAALELAPGKTRKDRPFAVGVSPVWAGLCALVAVASAKNPLTLRTARGSCQVSTQQNVRTWLCQVEWMTRSRF